MYFLGCTVYVLYGKVGQIFNPDQHTGAQEQDITYQQMVKNIFFMSCPWEVFKSSFFLTVHLH